MNTTSNAKLPNLEDCTRPRFSTVHAEAEGQGDYACRKTGRLCSNSSLHFQSQGEVPLLFFTSNTLFMNYAIVITPTQPQLNLIKPKFGLTWKLLFTHHESCVTQKNFDQNFGSEYIVKTFGGKKMLLQNNGTKIWVSKKFGELKTFGSNKFWVENF